MGNHNHRTCYEFVLFLRVFMKNGQMVNYVEMMF